MVRGVIVWLLGNRRHCDCNVYVSLIASSADRVPKVRILLHLRGHIHVLNVSLCLIDDPTRRCVAQD
jgi:hypothetical protein